MRKLVIIFFSVWVAGCMTTKTINAFKPKYDSEQDRYRTVEKAYFNERIGKPIFCVTGVLGHETEKTTFQVLGKPKANLSCNWERGRTVLKPCSAKNYYAERGFVELPVYSVIYPADRKGTVFYNFRRMGDKAFTEIKVSEALVNAVRSDNTIDIDNVESDLLLRSKQPLIVMTGTYEEVGVPVRHGLNSFDFGTTIYLIREGGYCSYSGDYRDKLKSNPKPGYLLLIPPALLIDIVTSPVQLVGFLMTGMKH